MVRNAIKSYLRTSTMTSTNAGGHFVKIKQKKRVPYRSKVAKNSIKNSVSIWNGQNCDRKWISEIQKWLIDLKWPEMRSKVNFGRRQPFCQKFQKTKCCISIWNGQKCDWKWFSDILNGRRQPFCKIIQTKICIDLKWPEMWSKVNFGHPKWPTAAILSNKI